MTNTIYTVITFAPVQGFIEKSRKLRDLYGSSYLLSYLSWVICNAAEKHGCQVISPALPNITQGMPNQIIIKGDFPEEEANSAFLTAWKCVTETCREWIEENIKDKWEYTSWKRSWLLWTKYAWEFFWVQGKVGESISDVREKLNEKKRPRDWTGINWQGESSTLSGADAIAYPKLGQISDPRKYDYQAEKKAVTEFYKELSQKLGESLIDVTPGLNFSGDEKIELSKEYGESFIAPEEELSIPELIKRLITHKVIADKLTERLKQVFGNNVVILKNLAQQIKQLSSDLKPTTFKDLSRLNKNKSTSEQKEKSWTGWFRGDGDKAGDYLKSFAKSEECEKLKEFSTDMRQWADYLKKLPDSKTIANWRVVYAGGDDFLGVFYERKDATDCVDFFSTFKSQTWNQGKVNPKEKKRITVSVGFVWAFPDIPQRDILQNCREAEKSAKNNGRDRIAFRILFNNGNHLEWVCPWWLLEAGLLSSYRDRDKNESKPKQNWTHIYNDVAVLESRHAFDEDGLGVALGLLEIYFPKCYVDEVKDKDKQLHQTEADLTKTDSGILGECKMYYKENSKEKEIDEAKVNKALTNWIINLAKVGFHLCQQ